LYPAMPQQAQIAIMLSRASDTWDTEDIGGGGHLYSAKFNVNNEERKAIWLALRHAQFPVDLITDEDIADGHLGTYRVLYIVGSEMLRAAVEPLMSWVKNGGVVYATGGGGLLDEYHAPLEMLYHMYGVKEHKLIRHTRHIRPRKTLKEIKSYDELHIEQLDKATDKIILPAYLYRETLQPESRTDIVGKYSTDNSAGLIVNNFGKGRTIYCGLLAGIAYLKPAITESSQVLPTDFPDNVRRFLTAPAIWADVVSPVQTSDPLVETQYFCGAEGDIVVLINWRDESIENLVVRFPGKTEIRSVCSLRKAGYFRGHLHEQKTGTLSIRYNNGIPEVELDLGISDYLLADP